MTKFCLQTNMHSYTAECLARDSQKKMKYLLNLCGSIDNRFPRTQKIIYISFISSVLPLLLRITQNGKLVTELVQIFCIVRKNSLLKNQFFYLK